MKAGDVKRIRDRTGLSPAVFGRFITPGPVGAKQILAWESGEKSIPQEALRTLRLFDQYPDDFPFDHRQFRHLPPWIPSDARDEILMRFCPYNPGLLNNVADLLISPDLERFWVGAFELFEERGSQRRLLKRESFALEIMMAVLYEPKTESLAAKTKRRGAIVAKIAELEDLLSSDVVLNDLALDDCIGFVEISGASEKAEAANAWHEAMWRSDPICHHLNPLTLRDLLTALRTVLFDENRPRRISLKDPVAKERRGTSKPEADMERRLFAAFQNYTGHPGVDLIADLSAHLSDEGTTRAEVDKRLRHSVKPLDFDHVMSEVIWCRRSRRKKR